jgi:hypothetical protein
LTISGAYETFENLKSNHTLRKPILGFIIEDESRNIDTKTSHSEFDFQMKTDSYVTESSNVAKRHTGLAGDICHVLRYFNQTLTSLDLQTENFYISMTGDYFKYIPVRMNDEGNPYGINSNFFHQTETSLKQTISCCNMFLRLNAIGRKTLCSPMTRSSEYIRALTACRGDLDLIFWLCTENPLRISNVIEKWIS